MKPLERLTHHVSFRSGIILAASVFVVSAVLAAQNAKEVKGTTHHAIDPNDASTRWPSRQSFPRRIRA